MTLIFREEGFKWRFYSLSTVVDGGGNKFVAYVQPKGATADVVVKRQAAGAPEWVELRRVVTPSTNKADNVSIMQSGVNLHLFYSSHEADAACSVYEEALVGICVPYGAAGPQLGAPGATVPGEITNECPSVSDIVTGIKMAIDPGRGDIGKAIKNAARAAIVEERVLRVSSNDDEKYSILRHDTRDGAYEALVSYHEGEDAPQAYLPGPEVDPATVGNHGPSLGEASQEQVEGFERDTRGMASEDMED